MKIFASDIDGTFIERGKKPSKRTREAFKLLQDKGYLVVGASGRVSSSTKNVFESVGVENTYIIANNGSIILDKSGEVIFEKTIEKSALKKLLEIADKHNVEARMYDKDTLYAKTFEESKVRHLYLGDGKYSVNFVTDENILDIVLADDKKILKMFMYVDYREYHELYEDLKSVEGIQVNISGETCIDCVAQGISKGNALKYLAEMLGVDMADTVAIGDQDNDLEMIKFAGTGIAMGNAIDTVKEAATFVTDRVENEGFYVAVKN